MSCQRPGKCVYDDVKKTGVHFCVLPRCPFAEAEENGRKDPEKEKARAGKKVPLRGAGKGLSLWL